MARTMRYTVDVSVPAEVMYGHFTAITYWEDLVAFYRAANTRTEIAHFASDSRGTDVHFSHILSADDLPAIARPVVPGRFVVTRQQHFEPFDSTANTAAGRYLADIPTVPVELAGTYILRDAVGGSQMQMDSHCTVRAPLIGGKIEQWVLGGLESLFAQEGEFTTEWINRHS